MFRVKFRGCYFAMGTIVIIFAATFPALPYLGEYFASKYSIVIVYLASKYKIVIVYRYLASK